MYEVGKFLEDYEFIVGSPPLNPDKAKIEYLLDSLKFREIPPQDYIRGVLYKEDIKSFSKLFLNGTDDKYVDYVRRRKARIEIAEKNDNRQAIIKYLQISRQQTMAVAKAMNAKSVKDIFFYKLDERSNPLMIKMVDLGITLPGILIKHWDIYEELYHCYSHTSLPTLSELSDLRLTIYTDRFLNIG